MSQTSGIAPALYDGVGTGKKKARKKTVSVAPGVKAKLDKLHARVQQRRQGK